VLFEFLILEGAQAGLSWLTILKRRESYRQAFAGFDPQAIARFGPRQLKALMANPGVIRNRLKIEGAVKNAQAFLAVCEEQGAFAPYIWSFVDGRPIVNRPAPGQPIPATSPQSDAMSKALKKRGFTFVGSTICYAFMQAAGMVNDHARNCFRAPGAPISRLASTSTERSKHTFSQTFSKKPIDLPAHPANFTAPQPKAAVPAPKRR
jgi:DNA-3-methyladenine glycosylase I